jgi:hypothetical protein
MLSTKECLMFPEFYMSRDTKAKRYEIIAVKTLLNDIIAGKTTQPLRFEFISFIGRKRDKASTNKYSKKGIVWEFVIKQLKRGFIVSSR